MGAALTHPGRGFHPVRAAPVGTVDAGVRRNVRHARGRHGDVLPRQKEDRNAMKRATTGFAIAAALCLAPAAGCSERTVEPSATGR